MVELSLLDQFLSGLQVIFTVSGMAMVLLGVVLGILIGATPGLSPSMGVALLVPFSYGMDPALAFVLFVCVYQASNYGGSITAIAINAPGTASSVVTAIDGYELTRRGTPGKALGMAVFASSLGGLIGTVILVLFALPIARFGLAFGPAEYFSLAFFGLTTVIAFAQSEWNKTLCGILLGLLLSCIGTDPFSGDERFTFGVLELFDGFAFIPAMIGLFALAEIFSQIEQSAMTKMEVQDFSGELPSKVELQGSLPSISRSSLMGTLIGIIPGAGATIASFISYAQAKRKSKQPEEFGRGSLEGIAASEAANSASVGGALIPMLSLGIPGSATDAVLLGALTLHGLVAGPELFQSNPDIVYGIFVSLLLANFFILLFGLLGNKLWLQVIRFPKPLLFPLILSICMLGSYTMKNSIFDSWVCLGFGVFGWLLKRHGYKPAPIVLGLVLGEMLEMNFRRVLALGDMTLFFSKPISITLLALSLMTLYFGFRKSTSDLLSSSR